MHYCDSTAVSFKLGEIMVVRSRACSHTMTLAWLSFVFFAQDLRTIFFFFFSFFFSFFFFVVVARFSLPAQSSHRTSCGVFTCRIKKRARYHRRHVVPHWSFDSLAPDFKSCNPGCSNTEMLVPRSRIANPANLFKFPSRYHHNVPTVFFRSRHTFVQFSAIRH